MSTPPLHLLHIFSTFSVGGPQVRFSQIVNALGDAYRHTVVAMDNETAAHDLVDENIHCDILSLSGPSHKNHKALPFHQRLQLYRGTLEHIAPHKCVTYNWGSIEWALANLVPVVDHIHIEDGFGPEEAKRRFRRRNWMRRLALSNHTDIIVPSRTLETIATTEWRLPPEHMHYIPNGIDVSRFGHGLDPDLIRRFDLPRNMPIIGTIAALRREKNLHRLIDAFHQSRQSIPCHLVIIGDGSERQKLTDYTNTLGIADHVTFAGHISKPESILGTLDLFAISSDTEQMPYSVLEAMACGLPVIGTNVGDIKAMVSHENHPYITNAELAPFQNALYALLQNPNEGQRIGQANLERVHTDYSLTMMIDRYNAVFSS